MKQFVIIVTGIAVLAVFGLIAYEVNRGQEAGVREIIGGGKRMSVQTPAFPPGGTIAVKYTCDGENISPRILINGVPLNAKSLALVLDDADADGGPLTHWAMWNIPSSATAITEGTMPSGAVMGTTSFGTAKYTGPCPPKGERHRYVLRLYALDVRLAISPGAPRDEFLRALLGHELEEDEAAGFYRRP